jgi:hypothetical protein
MLNEVQRYKKDSNRFVTTRCSCCHRYEPYSVIQSMAIDFQLPELGKRPSLLRKMNRLESIILHQKQLEHNMICEG